MYMITHEKIKRIQLHIKEHIEKISGRKNPEVDKDISYMMIHEDVQILIKHHNESQDSQHRNLLAKALLEVLDELFNYLSQVNCWDKKILKIYKLVLKSLYKI